MALPPGRPRFSDDKPPPTADIIRIPEHLEDIPIATTKIYERRQSRSEIDVLIQLEGPNLEHYPPWYQRAPLDLVMVVDINNYYFDTDDFNLVQRAIMFVVRNIGPRDRLSIVSCTDPATRLTRLRPMDFPGQVDAQHAVGFFLQDGDPTSSFVDGVKIATEILEDRLYKNPVASIIVLSNVISNGGSVGQPRTMPVTENYPFPVHIFGVGQRRNDPVALYRVSLASRGTYSYVQSFELLEQAVAVCLGGLLSVVAQCRNTPVRAVHSHGSLLDANAYIHGIKRS
ncbi:E3 ubiquitin-protein ligase WAV3-like [Andrographis paniculata]|uniref:E3 ubiquitin-protein ligase WAV3-like n=1 Tax=Andrographis paniculata TaxID=175694 RepID=UPI0021E95F48|nr:E3 ubiquitin-protein ligase WAV3-like [Andrographis paniculata]